MSDGLIDHILSSAAELIENAVDGDQSSVKKNDRASALVVQNNAAPDAALAAPSSAPPKKSQSAYATAIKLKNHPSRRAQKRVDKYLAQNRQRYLEDAATKIGGDDNRRLNDHFHDSQGIAGVFKHPLSQTSIKGAAPAASNVQRNMLLNKKQEVLTKFENLKADLDPAPRNDPDKGVESDADVLNRMSNALTGLKGTVRELLIIAHAQRDEITARRDRGIIGSKDHLTTERELDAAIEELSAMDDDIHRIADNLEQLQKKNPDAPQRVLQAIGIAEDGRGSGSSLPVTHQDPRWLNGSIDKTSELLTSAWQNGPSFVKNLGSQKSLDAASKSGAEDADLRYGALRNILQAHSDVVQLRPENLKRELDFIDNQKGHLQSELGRVNDALRKRGLSDTKRMALESRRDDLDDCLQQLETKKNDTLRRAQALRLENKTPAQAMYERAESVGLADEIESRCRAQLESSITRLEAKLEQTKIPGLDPLDHSRQFGARFSALRLTAEKLTYRRHADDIDKKIQDINGELQQLRITGRQEKQTLSNGQIDDDQAADCLARIDQIDKRSVVLSSRMSKLMAGKTALNTIVKREIGIDLDELPGRDDLLREFDQQWTSISQHIDAGLKNYRKTSFKSVMGDLAAKLFKRRTRKQVAKDVRKAFERTDMVAESQHDRSGNLITLSSANGGSVSVTKAEFETTRRRLESEFTDSLRERTAKRMWSKISNPLSFAVGKKYYLALGKSAFKGLGAILEEPGAAEDIIEAEQQSRGIDAASADHHAKAFDNLEQTAVVVDVFEHAFGAVGGAVGTINRINAIKGKKRRIAFGNELCDRYAQSQDKIPDPVERAKSRQANRVIHYCGQQLQEAELGLDMTKTGMAAIASLRHAYAAGSPAFHSALTAAAPLSGIAAPVVGAALSGVDACFAVYETGKAVITRGELEDAAKNHRLQFGKLCTEKAGSKLDQSKFIDKDGKVDFDKARSAIDAAQITDGARKDLVEELGKLAVSEHLVEISKDSTKIDEKRMLILSKTIATAAYGTAIGVSVAAGGALMLNPVSIGLAGAAATAGGVYYAYKSAKQNNLSYWKERMTDASVGFADPNIINKLNAEAAAKNMSADALALHTIGKVDFDVLAEEQLGQLREETADVAPTPEEKQRRAELEGALETLSARVVELQQNLRGGGAGNLGQINQSETRKLIEADLKEIDAKEKELKKLESDIKDRISKSGSHAVEFLKTGLKLSDDVILALIEADEKNDEYSIKLLAERYAALD